MNRRQSKEWEFKNAQLHFGKIFRLARKQGPQRIVRSDEAVVVLAAEEYERLIKSAPKGKKTLVEFFAESPLVGSGIDLERVPDFGSNREDFGGE